MTTMDNLPEDQPNNEPRQAPAGELAPGEQQSATSATATQLPTDPPAQPTEAQAEERPAGEATQEDQANAKPNTAAADAAVLAASATHTRRSFVMFAAGAAATYGFYQYLDFGPQEKMQPVLLRDAIKTNAALSRAIFEEHVLAPTYPVSRAENLRVNGTYGLRMELKPESWRLQLVGVQNAAQHPQYVQDVTAWEYLYTTTASKEDKGHDTKVDPAIETAAKMAPESMMGKAQQDEYHTGRKPRGLEEAGESKSTLRPGTPGLLLTINDLSSFPRHELVTQFKCIEGWSQIVQWAGIRLADFLQAYPPQPVDGAEPRYLYMETPDGDYYTGYDLNAVRHPQALLVTEMMGAPLTQFHGAPLRLHMPTKYGYKQIKRIGLIAYTNQKPDDYWTKLGYDWYAGL